MMSRQYWRGMDLHRQLSDDAILGELGARLARARLDRGWTQAHLAATAGVSKRTLERIESGRSAQLTSFIRLCRALDLIAGLDALLPAEAVSPIATLRGVEKRRRRASGRPAEPGPREPWTWGDET